LKASFLPSRILILVVASCIVWIGLLSLAFMTFTGTDVTVGWICAAALFFALVVWTLVMAGEFRSAVETSPCRDEEEFDQFNMITSPLPGTGLGEISRRTSMGIRRFLPAAKRPLPRRACRTARPASR
jgi:hypothetical protein